MYPVTVAIIAAVTAGVASGAGQVASQAMVDAYSALKEALKTRFAAHDDLTRAVDDVERHPQSMGYQRVLDEQITESGAGADPVVLESAQRLRDALGLSASGAGDRQTAIGADIAQADHASTAQVTHHAPPPPDKTS